MLLAAERSTAPTATGDDAAARLFRLALSSKWVILAAAVAGTLLTGAILTLLTPEYRGEAVIIVESRRNKVAESESVLSGLMLDQPAVRSESDVLRSPEIARHVIAHLGLADTQDYRPLLNGVPAALRFAQAGRWLKERWADLRAHVGLGVVTSDGRDPNEEEFEGSAEDRRLERASALFAQRLDVVNDPKSFTIRISYKSSSPRLAAAVTNAVVERYFDLQAVPRNEATERNRKWLRGRLVEMRAMVAAAGQALEEHRARYGLANRRERDPLQEEMLVLRSRFAEAEVDVGRAAASVQQLESAGSSGAILAQLPEVLASDLVSQLRQQDAAHTARLSELQASLGSGHPQTLQARAVVQDTQRRIGAEIGRIASGLRINLATAQARRQFIESGIRDLQKRIDKANAADTTLRALEQDVAVARTVLDGFMRRYNEQLGQPIAAADSRVITSAVPPAVPVWPRYGLFLMFGTLGSACLAFGGVVLRSSLRSGFLTQREMAEFLSIPVAGLMPIEMRLRRRGRRAMARDSELLRETAVAVRAIAPRVTSTPGRGKVLVVASAVPGEGKSTLALTIARSASSSGQNCLLIDGDLRRPALHRRLGVEVSPGLTDAVAEGDMDGFIQKPASELFTFLAAGATTADPLQPFEGSSFGAMIKAAQERFDVIVIDTPAVLVAPEAVLLSGHADVTLFVAKWRSTPRELARKAVDMLRLPTAHCLGVLTQVDVGQLDRHETDRMEEAYRAYYRRQ